MLRPQRCFLNRICDIASLLVVVLELRSRRLTGIALERTRASSSRRYNPHPHEVRWLVVGAAVLTVHVQQLLRVVVCRGRARMALSTICLVFEAERTANEHMCYMMHVGDEREGASDGEGARDERTSRSLLAALLRDDANGANEDALGGEVLTLWTLLASEALM